MHSFLALVWSFERDVILYGGQTVPTGVYLSVTFERDVILYGGQTLLQKEINGLLEVYYGKKKLLRSAVQKQGVYQSEREQ